VTGHGARRLGDELLRGLPPQRLEQPLHDRMLLLSELMGIAFAQADDDGERSWLWLRREPTLDRGDATMSISQKPGGGLFQSLKVRIGTSRRIAE
jgi:hypothetical protein